MIMQGAEPFLLPGGTEGVLLVHGMSGSPSEMLLLGQFLQRQGYTVLCPRLAGHGTSPKDMQDTGARDWFDSVCDGYALLAGMAGRISVAGLSMGGLLAILLATQRHVERVVTMAAPIYIAESSGIRELPPRRECRDFFVPKQRRHLPNVPPACNLTYHRMPVLCVHELLDIIGAVKRRLPELSAPLLVLQGRQDHTIEPRSAEFLYTQAGSEQKELAWLEESGHIVPLDAEREEAFRRIAGFLKE